MKDLIVWFSRLKCPIPLSGEMDIFRISPIRQFFRRESRLVN